MQYFLTKDEWSVSEDDWEKMNLEEEVKQLQVEVNGETYELEFEAGYINLSGNLTPPDGYSQCISQKIPANIANGLGISFNNSIYRVMLVYYNGDTFVERTSFLESPVTISTEHSVRITLLVESNSFGPYTIDEMVSAYTFTGLPDTVGLKDRVLSLEVRVNDVEDNINNLSGDISDISDEVTYIESILAGYTLEWSVGSINNNGEIISPTCSNYYSQIVPSATINNIAVTAHSGFQWNLALYDTVTGDFVGRLGWKESRDGKIEISTTYKARIILATTALSETLPIADILAGFTIEGVPKGIENRMAELEVSVSNLENKGDYALLINACDFDGKILHFSFDDVCWCLYDLIQNEAIYEDIFDEPFFAMLKEVHDANGMVFTLNTFNEVDTNTYGYYPTGFDIFDVPTKFQSDFQVNKGWLKFAFHAKNENTNYNTDTGAGNDYATFVSAIYTLTGDYDCIDHVARLGYFGGTLENCLALRDAPHGVVGFFGADDTRAYDYYLTSDQYNWLRKKGKFFDEENELFFIKTQYRTLSTGKQNVENNLCFQKVTEFFAHEYEANTAGTWNLTNMKNNLISLATWATGLGYKFNYPEDIYG